MGAAFQPADPAVTASVPEPPLLEPAFSVTIDAPAQFRGIVFHPDGTRAFVHVSDPAIDLWPLAVYYWPEILGALAVLLALPALWVIWRRARRPRREGRLFCRRCNYDLGPGAAKAKSVKRKANIRAEAAAGAAVAARCPECGTETAKRRPVAGRRLRRRLAMPVAWVLAFAAAYGAMHAARLPREGWLSERFFFGSRLLDNVERRWGLPRSPLHIYELDRVLGIDLRSPPRTRTLRARQSGTEFEMTISCDGSRLFLETVVAGGIVAVDGTSGRVAASLAPPAVRVPLAPLTAVVPSGRDPNEVFLLFVSPPPALTTVRRWDMSTGSATDSFVVPWRRARGFDLQALARQRLPEDKGAPWLVYPVRDARSPRLETNAQLLSDRGEVVGEFAMDALADTTPRCIIAEPVPQVVVLAAQDRRLDRIAIGDGKPLDPVTIPVARPPLLYGWPQAAGSRLLIAFEDNTMWVYDARQERWIARLNASCLNLPIAHGIAGNGRFAFAARWPEGRGGPPTTLTIWDLSRIPPAPGEPSPPGP